MMIYTSVLLLILYVGQQNVFSQLVSWCLTPSQPVQLYRGSVFSQTSELYWFDVSIGKCCVCNCVCQRI